MLFAHGFNCATQHRGRVFSIIRLLFLTNIISSSWTMKSIDAISTQQQERQQQELTVSRRNLDLFNYKRTVSASINDGIYDYGPDDWDQVQCPNPDICVRLNETSWIEQRHLYK
jgi:hypothetical protein